MTKLDEMIEQVTKQLEQATAQANFLAGQLAALETLRKLGATLPPPSLKDAPAE